MNILSQEGLVYREVIRKVASTQERDLLTSLQEESVNWSQKTVMFSGLIWMFDGLIWMFDGLISMD